MRTLSGNEVRQAVRGRWLSQSKPVPINGVSIDSRTAVKNDLFVAIRGKHFDGHAFLQQAAKVGCFSAIVNMDSKPSADVMQLFPGGVIGVDDTRNGLLDLGGFYRSILPATIIAVTGSNGKTTVKRMIHHVLGRRLVGTCSPKNFNNEIGVSLTLLAAGAGDDYVICEVGSSAPGEVSRLARAIRPNIPVITNVAPAHLEKFQSLEGIAVEKASLLDWLSERDLAVVSADSPQLDYALKSYQQRMIRFGESPDAQLRLTEYETDGRTQRFQVNNHQWFSLRIPGRHNAINALATVAVCARFGFAQEEIAATLEDFGGVTMRLEWIEADEIQIINDAYNANPASLTAAMDVLCDNQAARRVLIIGDMLELGDQSESIHTNLGRDIAMQGVDLIVGVGTLGGLVATAAAAEGKPAVTFATVTHAGRGIGRLLRPGDLVLLKGSRAMGMEKLIPTITRPFARGPAPEPRKKVAKKPVEKAKKKTTREAAKKKDKGAKQ